MAFMEGRCSKMLCKHSHASLGRCGRFPTNPLIRIPVLAIAILATSVACDKTAPSEAEPIHEEEAHEHDEEHIEAKVPSDLDRPIEELLDVACEHDKRAFECDDCRYEVGFVRVPGDLLDGGLVTTEKAERRKVAIPIALTGEIGFDERRIGHVSSHVVGLVKKVHVALGEQVKKGQPLVEVESVLVGEEQVDYLEARSMAELARRSYERVTELHREGLSSDKDLFSARQEFEAARIRASGAHGKLMSLGTVGTTGGRVVLRSPLDGAVLLMHAVPGELAVVGETLLTVGDSSEVWVWVDLYERDIEAVMKGRAAQALAASITVRAWPGEEFAGTLDYVGPAMDESSRTVKARVTAKNPDGRLLAGMFAAVDLFVEGMQETLAVSEGAVLEDDGRTFVFVHHQGELYLRRPVVRGREWDGWVEVEQGLEPSRIVVSQGAFLLKSDVLRAKMGAGCAD